MRPTLLLVAILASFAGNLSGSPDKSVPTHKQEVAQQPPGNASPVTVVVQNTGGSEPASTPAAKPPSGNAPAEWVLVLVGIVTAGFVCWQAWETRRSVLVNLRPRLKIRGIALVDEGEKGWKIDCLIANTGGSLAKITDSNLTIKRLQLESGKLPTLPPYDNTLKWLDTKSSSIASGEQEQVSTYLGISNPAFNFSFMRAAQQAGYTYVDDAYCFGFIQYRDEVGVRRRTAFCLHYVTSSNRFNRVDNEPTYDYED